MASIRIQFPLDQPLGRVRLLDVIEKKLDSPAEYKTFRFMVAFAKSGPFRHLANSFESWAEAGNRTEAVFGIDEQGTSAEALQFALDNFDEVRILHQDGPFTPTFHPKIYHFAGESSDTILVGSNNFTSGGMETNFESHIKLELSHSQDRALLKDFQDNWAEIVKHSKELDSDLLDQLVDDEKVISEKEMRERFVRQRSSKDDEGAPAAGDGDGGMPTFPDITVEPRRRHTTTPSTSPSGSSTTGSQDVTVSSALSALVMEVKQRPNGEIHLSYGAAKKRPDFFNYPFSGKTVPKKQSNNSYPQRDPKPVVDFTLYDSDGNEIVTRPEYRLTMVDYAKRSEIRITFPQDDIKEAVGFTGPEYCLLVMKRAPEGREIEYDIDIYIPGSQFHHEYRKLCDTQMPAGGSDHPRSYGWIINSNSVS